MKKILLVKEILNGLINLIKSINCKIVCCCESSCNQPNEENKHYDL